MYFILDRKKRTKIVIFYAVVYEVLIRSLLFYMMRVSKLAFSIFGCAVITKSKVHPTSSDGALVKY